MSNEVELGPRPQADRPPVKAHTSGLKRQRNRRDPAIDGAEQIRVLSLLRETLVLHHEALDDPEVMLIIAEGETDLMQVLDCMIDADVCDDAFIQGLKSAKDTMSARLHRLEERKKSRRAIIEQTLMLLHCASLERPAATISLSERPPSLVIDEEALVPAQFFDLKPVLNRRRAKEALEAGEQLAGAHLSSGVITLTVRRR